MDDIPLIQIGGLDFEILQIGQQDDTQVGADDLTHHYADIDHRRIEGSQERFLITAEEGGLNCLFCRINPIFSQPAPLGWFIFVGPGPIDQF